MFDELLGLAIESTMAYHGQSASYYAQQGQGDLLILVHGSLCDLRYWRWQINKLHTHCQVVSLSLPGYWPNTASTSVYEFSIKNHLAAIADVIKQLRQPNQKVYLLGHSRGAYIATQYACKHTGIDGLILADPAFSVDQPIPSLAVLNEAASLIASGQDDAGLGLFIDAVSGKNTWRKMAGWFKTMVEDNAHTLIAQSREELVTITNDQIQPLAAMPLGLISGVLSPQRYKCSIQDLMERLPHANHTIIGHASHGMNLANPKAFNQAVLGFIQSASQS